MKHTEPTGSGVIIGRFQVADLTKGHAELIHRVARKHNKVIILLGVNAKLSTKENPLGYESREKLLRDYWADTLDKNTSKPLIIAPLPDRATDALWSKQVDVLLDSLVGPRTSKTLYGGRDSCVEHYITPPDHGGMEIGDLRNDFECESDTEFEEIGSATEQRAALFEQPPTTEEGRAGAIWAVGNQWTRLDPCVDMAVTFKNCDGYHLLMGKKLSGVGKYCFPGGHVDGTDESAEFAATREIKEETGLDNLPPWDYVCQVPVNDWRNTKTCQTWSTLFTVEITKHISGEVKADDDLDEVHWVNMDAVTDAEISPTHLPMFNILKRKLGLHVTEEITEGRRETDDDKSTE